MAKLRDAAKGEYWRGVIRRFEASGLGVRGFCDREGLSEHRFYWWRRALRRRGSRQARCPRGRGRRGEAPPGDDQPSQSSFLPVGLPFSVGGPIEIVHPRGHVIRVPALFDANVLGRILAAIDGLTAGTVEPAK